MSKLVDGRPGFYAVYNNILDDYGSQMGVYGIAIYNVLCRFANNVTGESFPSYQTIARLTGMSRRQAIDAVNTLLSLGLISKESRRDGKQNKTNVYTILMMYKRHEPSAGGAPGVVQAVHQVVQEVHPEQDVLNNTKREKEKESLSSEPTATATEQSETVYDSEGYAANGFNAAGYKRGDTADPSNNDVRKYRQIQLDNLKREVEEVGMSFADAQRMAAITLRWTKETALSKLNTEKGDAVYDKHIILAKDLWELGINTASAWKKLAQKVESCTFSDLHANNILKFGGAVADEMGITQATEATVHTATPVEGDIAHE